MLFNSLEFLFLFLPVTLISYYFLINKIENDTKINFLIFVSLIFYGWWNFKYLFLIIFSIMVNYLCGLLIINSQKRYFLKKFSLIMGVFVNLSILVYFKYSNFFIENINELFGLNFILYSIILPLGISFFTFQQISFLMDLFRNEKLYIKMNYYFLFVTFFPQLIAGPIVNYREMVDQYDPSKNKLNNIWSNLSIGITLITIGLFKKVIIADKLAFWSDKAFVYSANEGTLTFLESWLNVLCFSFQIYFDFSAYSDIALGLALLFGFKLPINFFSPYKATNIIEFWRLWHITLSRFLKNYLYIPLGGNKFGKVRQFVNLFVVMAIGGFWHGASWTFILWGIMHGIFLSINHYLNYAYTKLKINFIRENKIYFWISRILTFFLVSFAWVLFRSDDLNSAKNMYLSLFGFNGFSLPTHYEFLLGSFSNYLKYFGVTFENMTNYGGGMQVLWVLGGFFWVWFLPNSIEFMQKFDFFIKSNNFKFSSNKNYLYWVPNKVYNFIFSTTLIIIIIKIFQGQEGEFIYFQF